MEGAYEFIEWLKKKKYASQTIRWHKRNIDILLSHFGRILTPKEIDKVDNLPYSKYTIRHIRITINRYEDFLKEKYKN